MAPEPQREAAEPQLAIGGAVRTRMHAIALALLLAAAALLGVAHFASLPPQFAGYLRAFAEAALVGGLADWFAVVALFRHPLGIPIPHTAIIPQNKERIGVALGEFVATNFLTRSTLAEQLARVDIAAGLADVLADTRRAPALAARLTELAPQLLSALEASAAHELLSRQLARALTRIDGAALASRVLDALLTREQRHALFEHVLAQATSALAAAEPELRQRIHARSGWLSQQLRLDERVADRVLDGAEDLLADIAADPSHPWRTRFDVFVDDFIDALQHEPAAVARIESLKLELLEHPLFAELVTRLWSEFTAHARQVSTSADTRLSGALEALLVRFGTQLQADVGARTALNDWLRGSVVDIVVASRAAAGTLIADTVRAWDGATIARKLEQAVGRDLQFVRVNGTLFGGCVGLLLHGIGQLIGA